jgi:hypothetical protein
LVAGYFKVVVFLLDSEFLQEIIKTQINVKIENGFIFCWIFRHEQN